MSRDAILQTFEGAYSARSLVFGSEPSSLVRGMVPLLGESANVLDVGSGDGRNSLFLLERGFSVRAIDYAPSAVRNLRAEAANRELDTRLSAETADIRQVDWPTGFDAVLAITVLENLEGSEQAKAIKRLQAACGLGGIAVIECHSDRDPSVSGSSQPVSEFAGTIVEPMGPNDLLQPFIQDWRILHYSDVVFEDTTHGPVHQHGWVSIMAQRER